MTRLIFLYGNGNENRGVPLEGLYLITIHQEIETEKKQHSFSIVCSLYSRKTREIVVSN